MSSNRPTLLVVPQEAGSAATDPASCFKVVARRYGTSARRTHLAFHRTLPFPGGQLLAGRAAILGHKPVLSGLLGPRRLTSLGHSEHGVRHTERERRRAGVHVPLAFEGPGDINRPHPLRVLGHDGSNGPSKAPYLTA